MASFDDRLVELIGSLKAAAYSEKGVGGMIYVIAPGSEDWDYCYRRIAYLTSCWEGIYITGIKKDIDITVFVDEEVRS